MEQVGGVIAETVMGHVVEEWQATAANTVVMSGASCQHVWPIPKSRRYNYIPPEQAAGTIASDPMPLQDSACLVKRSAFGQRWGIGRLFHVGLPENGQSGGRLNPALVSAINDFGESLEEAISVATPDYTYTLVPVLPAYDAMGIPRKLQILEVTLTNDIIKTQRRRRPGKGI